MRLHSAEPIFPRKGIDHFADPAAYHEMVKTLHRKIDFPKLVVTGDFHSDRCKEDGKFILVLPDDLMADRMVKAVCKIDVIHF